MGKVHALLFTLLGALMGCATALAPGFFPPGSLDGANTSALWLQVMGGLNGFIGVTILTEAHLVPFLNLLLSAPATWHEEAMAPLETLVQLHGEPRWRAIV